MVGVGGGRGIWEISVLSAQFCCESKTAPKNSLFKKRDGFSGGAVVENLPANSGNTGSSPGPGRSHML